MQEDGSVDRRAAKLTELLRATDVPAPPMAFPAERIAAARRRARLRWQLAAAAVLLVLAAGAVRPVRAWIAETARQLFRGAPDAPSAAPAAPADTAAGPSAPVAANMVTFTPRGGAFVVELAVRQQGGALVLAPVGGAEASVALVGDPADAEFLVRPDGVRIGNRAGARADYVVRVPAGVARVTVRVGREPPQQVPVSREHDVQLPLGPRTERPE